MTKLEEAKNILTSLNVPLSQQSEICCYTLLAMASISKKTKWQEAKNEWIRIHDVIAFIKENYNVAYAENSRETFRKQALHHFRNAAFIEDNDKATNSPNYRYRITNEMLTLLKSFNSDGWEEKRTAFLSRHNSLIDL